VFCLHLLLSGPPPLSFRVRRKRMTPSEWHREVLELARQRLAELPSPADSKPLLLFIRHGQIHCRTLFSDSRDADEPSSAHYQIWKRIDDLRGTDAEAYAVASLTICNSPSAEQCWAIDVQGAERADAYETTWLQRISFDSETGQITGHECWPFNPIRRPNALSPLQNAGARPEAEPGAPPNGGPAGRLGNSGAGGGPPSVI
jgi:hypothetical protein